MPLVGYSQWYGKKGSTLASTSVVLHGNEKLLVCSQKVHSCPAGLWEHSAAGFTDKEASLSSPTFTQFSDHPCVRSLPAHMLGPLPLYVVDSSSPKQPWKGGGDCTCISGQPSHSGEIQDHSRTHGPKAPLCIFKHVLCSPFPVLSITHKPDFFASTIMIEIAPLFGVLTAATQCVLFVHAPLSYS